MNGAVDALGVLVGACTHLAKAVLVLKAGLLLCSATQIAQHSLLRCDAQPGHAKPMCATFEFDWLLCWLRTHCRPAGPAGPKPWDLMPQISCPVLVAWGDTDPFTPLDGPVGQYFLKQAMDRPNTEVSEQQLQCVLGICLSRRLKDVGVVTGPGPSHPFQHHRTQPYPTH